MSKDAPAIPDTFLDAFGEDREKMVKQVKEELREEMNQKLQRLHNKKIKRKLLYLMKLLDIA